MSFLRGFLSVFFVFILRSINGQQLKCSTNEYGSDMFSTAAGFVSCALCSCQNEGVSYKNCQTCCCKYVSKIKIINYEHSEKKLKKDEQELSSTKIGLFVAVFFIVILLAMLSVLGKLYLRKRLNSSRPPFQPIDKEEILNPVLTINDKTKNYRNTEKENLAAASDV